MAAEERVRSGLSIEQEELRGISRTVAEIHWLLLILVLVYLVFGGERGDPEANAAVSAGLFFYAALVMSFRYANFYKRETRWKIAFETLGMITFITWVLWHTDGLASPLINAYLLPVITSALTLGKLATLANVGLIAACYIFLGSHSLAEIATLRFVAGFAAQLAPVLLVAYITTMFSADIRYGLQQAKLLSETDELTGLFNTRGFAIAANRLFGQAQRYGRPASVLMIDCDNLKTVNDTPRPRGRQPPAAPDRERGPGRAARHRRAGALRRRRVHRAAAGDAAEGRGRRRRAHPPRDRRAAARHQRRERGRLGEHRLRLLSGGRPHPRRARGARRPRAVPGEAGRP